MTDTFSKGQFTVDEHATVQNQPRSTWTIGQFRADQNLYSTGTMTTDQEEKIKSPRFAFLKIFPSTHCTHPANPAEPTLQTKVCGKSAILPAH